NDGSVWDWGRNNSGQLGDGTNNSRNTPVQVRNLTGIILIAAGSSLGSAHNLALKNDGTLWAWGGNLFGQLGDGTTVNRNTPVQVRNLVGVVSMAVGDGHSLACMNDGTVRAWGSNAFGQLGDGTTIDRHMPVQVLSGDVLTNAPPDAAAAGITFPLPGT